MNQGTSKKSLFVISALAGSSVGLLEATWVIESKASLADGVLVLLNGALGYAVCALLVTAVWYALVSIKGRGNPDQAWATAASAPFGIIISLIFITKTTGDGNFYEILMGLLPAGALGILATMVLRRCIRRYSILSRTSVWLAVHGIALLLGIIILAQRKGHGPGLWILLLLSLIMVGAVSYIVSRRSRLRLKVLYSANILTALTVLLLPFMPWTAPTKAIHIDTPFNVLLISVDTLRADHLGAYGYANAKTPNIDLLAAQGVQVLEAVAPVPLTGPSHSSILTGLYPIQHGSLHNGTPLPAKMKTLPEILAREGYQTAAVVSGYTLKNGACGLGGKFETFNDNFSSWSWLPDNATRLKLWEIFARAGKKVGLDLWRTDRPAGRTTSLALRWIENARQHPFFLWIHYFDPHEPYEPPAPYDRLHDPEYEGPKLGHWYRGVSNEEKEKVVNDPGAVRHMVALYDGEISYVDAEIGRLLEALKSWGLSQNTLLILTSDHGESLGEHNYYFEHSNYLYEEELRVPLIFLFPQANPEGQMISGQVRLIDITPTVLDYLGIRAETPMEGNSMMPLITGKIKEMDLRAFSAVHPGAWKSGRSIYALRDQKYKLIWTSPQWRFFGMRIPFHEELYDLTADPAEQRNIVEETSPEVLDKLRHELGLWRGKEQGTSSLMPDKVKRRLRSLGYVQ